MKASQKPSEMALYVELPKFDFPVVFGEMVFHRKYGKSDSSSMPVH